MSVCARLRGQARALSMSRDAHLEDAALANLKPLKGVAEPGGALTAILYLDDTFKEAHLVRGHGVL